MQSVNAIKLKELNQAIKEDLKTAIKKIAEVIDEQMAELDKLREFAYNW